MIEATIARRQVLRLTRLSGFWLTASEADQASRQELVVALGRVSRDPDHAGRIISLWLESSRFVPTPADIYEFGRQTDREHQPQHWKCATCDGTGWREIYQHVVWTTGNSKNVTEISAEEYARLRPKVTTTSRKKNKELDEGKMEQLTGCEVSGIIGQDIVQTSVVRCVNCRTGRQRAEADIREQNEAHR